MGKFVEGNTLNVAIEKLIDDAYEYLFLISPYIKLHSRLKDRLKAKLKDDKLKIVIVFGKNDGDYYKSMPKEEFEFFAQFPNIEIKYEDRLHAKFYANQNSSLLSSMNLYDYSQNNNIEAGISLDSSNQSFYGQAREYFNTVIENSRLLFRKEPQYNKSVMGLKRTYDCSIITENQIESILHGKKITPKVTEVSKEGFCIRCGTTIDLKPTVPYCKKCYDSWKQYKNEEYTEKYCHICGKETKTNLVRPTCYSCFSANKNKLEFKLK